MFVFQVHGPHVSVKKAGRIRDIILPCTERKTSYRMIVQPPIFSFIHEFDCCIFNTPSPVFALFIWDSYVVTFVKDIHQRPVWRAKSLIFWFKYKVCHMLKEHTWGLTHLLITAHFRGFNTATRLNSPCTDPYAPKSPMRFLIYTHAGSHMTSRETSNCTLCVLMRSTKDMQHEKNLIFASHDVWALKCERYHSLVIVQ